MSRSNSKNHSKLIFIVILLFVFVTLATTAIIQAIKNPSGNNGNSTAIVNYDDSLTDTEISFIESALKDAQVYDKPINLNFRAETARFELPKENSELGAADTAQNNAKTAEKYIIYDIKVPATSFYDNTIDISAADVDKFNLVSITDLTPDKRVLSIDGEYFLDTTTSGAEFRLIYISGEDTETVENTKNTLSSNAEFANLNQNLLSFAQTGVTALSRNMLNTLNGRAGGNGAYFAEKIKDFLSSKDLTHISNESSFADNCTNGPNSMSLCTDWRMLDTITAIGTDIVELTGNHNNNYGGNANIASIKKYHELGIGTVGGGINSEKAALPLRITQNATETTEYTTLSTAKPANITFLAYNNSTSSVANGELSTLNTPGANGYDEERAKSDIEAAKARGDTVIVDIQFFECYCYPDGAVEYPPCDAPIANQEGFFRHFVDLGADIVVGTQAHQPQTYELYKGKPIYYGLGNLFFDQINWPDTEKGLILTHYFYKGKYIQTRISPTIFDSAHQVELMPTNVATNYLKRLLNSSPEGN